MASSGGRRLRFHHWRGADDRRRFNNRRGFFNGGNGRFFDNSGFFFGNRWLRSDGFFSSWSRCGLSFFDYRLCWLSATTGVMIGSTLAVSCTGNSSCC